MRGKSSLWPFGLRMSSFAAPALLALAGNSFAAESVPPPALPAVAPAVPEVLDLHQCREVALAQQPAIAASRASLSAAVLKQQALDKLRLAALLQRDLPIRRKQSAVGVEASQAALTQAEWDTIHGVTFCYLSALYANEQLKLADDTIADLKRLHESVYKSVESGEARREIGKPQVDLIKTYLATAEGRREEALVGFQRAASALREAMGVAPDCPISLSESRLPDLAVTPDREQLIALAIARRGEVAQANAGYQATCFEIEAQKSTFFLKANTFAMGGDVHLTPVPPGDNSADNYKPGGIGIEMPPMMAGCRRDRVQQAEAYHERAGAVVDKTRNLVALETEQAYFKWLEASKKLPYYREAVATSDRVHTTVRTNFNPSAGGKGTVEDVVNAGFLNTSLKLQLNQTRYQLLLGLAALERDTAGGFCPGFEAPR
jgi:outer membrane protein TolC